MRISSNTSGRRNQVIPQAFKCAECKEVCGNMTLFNEHRNKHTARRERLEWERVERERIVGEQKRVEQVERERVEPAGDEESEDDSEEESEEEGDEGSEESE